MSKEILIELLPYLSTLITGIIVWYRDKIATKLGWKRTSKEIDTITLDNVQKNIDLYQELLNDLDIRYKNRVKEIEESFQISLTKLRGDLNDLETLNEKFEAINKEQRTLIQKLQKQLKYYQDNCKCLAEQVNN